MYYKLAAKKILTNAMLFTDIIVRSVAVTVVIGALISDEIVSPLHTQMKSINTTTKIEREKKR